MRVVFAVVLYNIPLEQSRTVNSLRDSLRQVTEFAYQVLVYDNSDRPIEHAEVDFPGLSLSRYGRNRGLAKAYNDALASCESQGADVLVTLDQDSSVTPSYLQALVADAGRLQGSLVALCPRIRSGDRIVSPYRIDQWGRRKFGATGPALGAINSFSAYSARFMRSIGGFDEFYWLDALDLSTYARVAKSGMSVGNLDVQVDHDLSLVSGRVSGARIRNIAFYETCFWIEYGGIGQIAAGLLRLIARAARVAPEGQRARHILIVTSAIARGVTAGLHRRASGRPGRSG